MLMVVILAAGPILAGSAAERNAPAAVMLESRADRFDDTLPTTRAEHTPLAGARRPWRLCAILPHVKDEYWLSVDYGMVEEARRLGVGLEISETGGYRSAAAQAEHLARCGLSGADAVILGSVSYDAPEIDAAIDRLAPRIPVVAAVNDVGFRNVAVKVGVSWRDMGARIGAVLAQRHPAGSGKVRAILATGPEGAGWVGIHTAGLRAALAGSDVEIVAEGHADTDAQEQLRLVEDLIAGHPDVDYLIGSGPAVDAAISVLRLSGTPMAMRLLATYYTQGVRRGLIRGRIEAAPFDDPRLQGRLAVEYAVRAIEGSVDHAWIGPEITLAEPGALPPPDALAPAGARLEFAVPPPDAPRP
jgi:protein TorT